MSLNSQELEEIVEAIGALRQFVSRLDAALSVTFDLEALAVYNNAGDMIGALDRTKEGTDFEFFPNTERS